MRRQRRSKRRWTGGLSAALVALIALLCICAGAAQAEKAADGKVIVNVNGGILPLKASPHPLVPRSRS